MLRSFSIGFGSLVFALLSLGLSQLAAQETSSSLEGTEASNAALAVPTAGSFDALDSSPNFSDLEQLQAQIQAELVAIEANSSLPEATQEALSTEYEQALADLGQAQANQAKLQEFKQLAEGAAQQEAAWQQQLAQVEAETDKQAGDSQAEALLSDADLAQQVRLQEASLQQLESQLDSTKQELAELSQRPEQIGQRLPLAKQELDGVRSALQLAMQGNEAQENNTQNAQRLSLLAKQAVLDTELALLAEEQMSLASRESLLRAQKDLLTAQQQSQQESLALKQELLQQQRQTLAQMLLADVEALQAALAEQNLSEAEQAAAKEILEQLKGYAQALSTETAQLEGLQEQNQAMRERVEAAQSRFERVQQQVELGGLESTFGQALLSEYRALGNPQKLELALKERQKQLRALRLAQLELEDYATKQESWQQRLADWPAAAQEFGGRLLASRARLLAELEKTQAQRIELSQQLNAQSRSLHELMLEFREFLDEKLFWTRSSPALQLKDLQETPTSLGWLFSTRHGQQLGRFFAQLWQQKWLLCLLLGLVLAVLLAGRRRLKALLAQSNEAIRSVRLDHYRHTLSALGATLLLSLPAPLVSAFLGWSLQQNSAGVAWMQGLGVGLIWTTWFLGFAIFLHQACAEQGLARAHFAWKAEFCQRLRRLILPLLIPFQALLLISYVCLYAIEAEHLGSLGRVSFLAAQVLLAVGLWRILRPALRLKKTASSSAQSAKKGDGSASSTELNRSFWKRKKRFILQGLLLLLPLMNLSFALMGFTLGAMALNAALLGSLCLIGAGVMLYSLLLRWFLVKQRKLALQELLEERQQRREAALAEAKKQEGEQHGEEFSVEVEESELDLKETISQTKRLLRSLSIISVILALWWYWERSLPIEEFLREQTLGSWISFLGLAQAALVVAVGLTLLRNLPGLLDLAGFRNSGIELGTRYAIVTICQYALGAIALVVLSKILGLNWSQFGWIAAALSLGLGFGLQEVVANFVCGIILLFERPIRVGDVVSLNGVTGTVSRIKMRATTITNWDRQDYVVPNKDLITGSLVNWTLLSPINRITIQVGVAYGSDTAQAMNLLREVAQEHPLVMEDPSPLISFDSFGESTLDLTLRCYLPTMDNRLKTTTELHSEINRKFAEAGIEIAFPQQDLNIRSIQGLPTMPRGK